MPPPSARGHAVVNAILEITSSVTYSSQMTEIRQTPIFRKWLDDLADRRAAERIAQRIVRLRSGLIGDVKPVGEAFRSCGSIMDLDTGFISCSAERC